VVLLSYIVGMTATLLERRVGYMTEHIGAFIKAARERKGITQRELARRAQVPASTVRDIEAGRVRSPRLNTLEAITSGLDLTVDSFIAQVGEAEATVLIDANLTADLVTLWGRLTDHQRELVLDLLHNLASH
jgi:transcriptional regulator with XRE-family HTH domain